MTNSDITPGPWYAFSNENCLDKNDTWYVTSGNENVNVNDAWLTYKLTEANAKLIAEAGTVYHETGLTPRQLDETLKHQAQLIDALEVERDELGRVLADIVDSVAHTEGKEVCQNTDFSEARAALANLEADQ